MKTRIVIVLLTTILAACAPVTTPTPTAVSPTITPTATFAISTPSPYPTQPPIPIMTPDAIQVERWKEYQAELAKVITCDSGHDCPNYEHALCEWDILGRADRDVYVWALCDALGASNRKPALIHLNEDGSIRNVEVPINGPSWDSDILRLFPADVREKVDSYFSSYYSFNSGRANELRIHLLYRQTHPEEPPLIVLSAMPITTPTP